MVTKSQYTEIILLKYAMQTDLQKKAEHQTFIKNKTIIVRFNRNIKKLIILKPKTKKRKLLVFLF